MYDTSDYIHVPVSYVISYILYNFAVCNNSVLLLPAMIF